MNGDGSWGMGIKWGSRGKSREGRKYGLRKLELRAFWGRSCGNKT